MLLAAFSLPAQPLSVGAKIGVPFGDAAANGGESRPYLIGPSVEVRLPAGFAIEAAGVYHRIGQTVSFDGFPIANGPVFYINRLRGNSWEFPLIGKRYFRSRASRWQPFVGTGWSLRTVRYGYEGVYALSGSPISTFKVDRLHSDLGVGAVFAGGVRIRAGRLAFSPEVRYTRWGSSQTNLKQNQTGLFLGFTF